jgi:hypothetical protein
MSIGTEKKEYSLKERLNAISKRLDLIDTSASKPEVVDYERVGDRISVIIRPRPSDGRTS